MGGFFLIHSKHVFFFLLISVLNTFFLRVTRQSTLHIKFSLLHSMQIYPIPTHGDCVEMRNITNRYLIIYFIKTNYFYLNEVYYITLNVK